MMRYVLKPSVASEIPRSIKRLSLVLCVFLGRLGPLEYNEWSRIVAHEIIHYSCTASFDWRYNPWTAYTLDGYRIGPSFALSHPGIIKGGAYMYTCFV